MGATAGHMLHPYENLDLTFDQMKGMFEAASKGFPKLKVTEKTDGQNIAIGYDLESGRALAIRNKSHAAAGGLDKESLKRYFTSDREAADKTPTPMNVVDSFYDAMENFKRVARSLPPEFFVTPEGERIFYNAEVMDPRSANVVDYDTQVLLIHRVGHKKLSGGELISLGRSEGEQRTIELENRIKELQTASQEISTVKVNAIINFTDFIEKKEAYRDAINELRVVQGSTKTVGEYLENRVLSLLKMKIGTNYSEQTYQLMTKALMYFATSKNMPRVKAEIQPVLDSVLEPEKQEFPEREGFIKEFLRTRAVMKDVVDRAMQPLMMVVHNFAVKLLEGFASGYTLQSDVSLEKLRKKVGSKAKEVTDPGDLRILKISLQKILGGYDVEDVLNNKALEAALEKITTSIEGLVFDYDGETYKFTGQFAPVNQMLGLGKYDRGSEEVKEEETNPAVAPTAQSTEIREEEEDDILDAPVEPPEALGGDQLTVAVVAGGFKPPHAGHYGMARYYADLPEVDEVRVIISPKDRAEHSADNRVVIDANISKMIWEIYTEKDPKIKVAIATSPNPVQPAYEVMDELRPGDKIMLGLGAKDAKCGDKRYDAVPRYAAEKGLEYDCNPVTPEMTGAPETLSATDIRVLIVKGDQEGFYEQLPEHIASDANKRLEVWDIVTSGSEKKISVGIPESISSLADICRLVEETLVEVETEKQRRWACAQLGDNFKGEKKLSKTQAKEMCKAKPKKKELEEDELEEISGASGMGTGGVGSVEGGAFKPAKRDEKRKKKKNTIIREEDNEQFVNEVLNYILVRGTKNNELAN